MRYFILLDFQHMVLALFLGLLALLLVFVAWRGYPRRGEEAPLTEEELFSSHGSSPPLPPLLVLVYVGAILWLLAYAVVQGIFGGAIT